MEKSICIHPLDNVAVALTDLHAGETVAGITLREDVPAGHKVALAPLHPGDKVIKYGCPIGHATVEVAPGSWLHTHNVRTDLSDTLTYTYTPTHPHLEKHAPDTFPGFPREDGRAGVRNEIWIIPTVGCVNDIASALARRAQKFLHGSVEDVIAFRHPYGCSQMGDDQENTRRLLADLIRHPNAGGVLVLGLGCENSGVDALRPYLGEEPLPRVRTLVCQEVEDELAAGEALLRELIDQAAPWERVPVSTEKLVIGLKCGGSDGFSGITANPTIGAFSDRLIARGGTTILTEVPEMFGAETLLMDRCESEAVFRQTVSLINDFKHYFTANHQTVYENPSPGNKKGGITTLEDKSLGCTQKSGSAPVVDVLPYAHRVERPGLNLLSAPGNDLVAATALAAAGAQIVLFSTGRGTPFACPVPTVKIASNPILAQRKRNWIDFSAAPALEGVSIEQLGEALYRKVLAVASGEPVKSEEAGFHDLAIFKQGVTL